jgi:signal transduction histidine kinase
VQLALAPGAGGVRRGVPDAGGGFAPAAALGQGDGYGLRGMKERARLLGGSLRLRSRPGHGTTVTALAPRPGDGAAP